MLDWAIGNLERACVKQSAVSQVLSRQLNKRSDKRGPARGFGGASPIARSAKINELNKRSDKRVNA